MPSPTAPAARLLAARELPQAVFLVGGLGAGKTELALNLARVQAEAFGPGKVHLLDVDIVNPYFRVRKVRDQLERAGVTVVMPGARVAESDIPALAVGIFGALERPELRVVVDVGGDVVGLRPLARLRELAAARAAAVWFVANPMRPGTRTVAEMQHLFAVLSEYSTLAPTAIVANPHLGGETTPEVFAAGLPPVREFARAVGLPLVAAMVDETLLPQLPPCREALLPLHRYWRVAWTLGVREGDAPATAGETGPPAHGAGAAPLAAPVLIRGGRRRRAV